MLAISATIPILYTALILGSPSEDTRSILSDNIWQADTTAIQAFISHLVAGVFLCSARSELEIAQTELKLLRGEQRAPSEVVSAQRACQDSAIVVGDSLFRQLRDSGLEPARRNILGDTYSYWRASMLELVPEARKWQVHA